MAQELQILGCRCTGTSIGAGAGKWLGTLQNALIVKRVAPVRVVAFCWLAVCGALCQSGRPTGTGLQQSKLLSTNTQNPLSTLPDAPSQVALTQSNRFKTVANEARVPFAVGAVELTADVVRATEATHVTLEAPLTVSALAKGAPRQEKSDDFFSKYLSAPHQQKSRYEPSSSGKVMARATDAASRIFVTRNTSGKVKLNTQYFLRALTSVAADSASRRYRARSGAAPLSDFGSTLGNDAGRNLLHEFGPGIRQKVTGHIPVFVSRIGERIARPQNRR